MRRGKATPQMSNYFDIDKWINKMNGTSNKESNSPTKELRRTNTLANFSDEKAPEKENYLLSKSNSTAHIPDNSRSKNVKRLYGNFDKDLAVRMFGYRVIFKKKEMAIKAPEPSCSQNHKPIQRFANDILGELSQQY